MNELILTGTETKIQELKGNKNFHFPANYSPENALKSAWLMIQNVEDKNKKKALDVCTQESIQTAMFDMVIQGLSPSKKQCYFMIYGNQLALHRSYFGTMAVTKRCKEVRTIDAQVVYQGDEFEFSYINAVLTVTKHVPNLDNINKAKIRATYCVIVDDKNIPRATIMTYQQLLSAWSQSRSYPFDEKGQLKPSSVHAKFPEEMAKRTVISRACKFPLNTSDDSDLFVEAVNRTTENEFVEVHAEDMKVDPLDKILRPKTDDLKPTSPPEQPSPEPTKEVSATQEPEKKKESALTPDPIFMMYYFKGIPRLTAGLFTQADGNYLLYHLMGGKFDHPVKPEKIFTTVEEAENFLAVSPDWLPIEK